MSKWSTLMKRSYFHCKRGRFTIRGMMYRPKGTNLPIAIVSHAFLCNQLSTRHYAKALAKLGYVAFCFDFVGGSARNLSSGWLRDMTVFTEVEDLKTVIRYAQSLDYTDSSRVTLMGCSQGGFVSALTAADLQTTIEKLILFYPALCIPTDARFGQMLDFSFDPQNVPPLIKAKGKLLHICGEYATSVMNMNAYSAITGYKGPVLLVYGSADEVVSQRTFKKAEKAFLEAGNVFQTLTIQDAMHGFKPKEDKPAIEAIKDFLLDIDNGAKE